MNWKPLQMIAQISVLLTLFFAITGCALPKGRPILPNAERCEQPELRGETWYDVAILSVEQRAAIEICNIRNGVEVPKTTKARGEFSNMPAPVDCRWSGVAVPDDAPLGGAIETIVVAPQWDIEDTCGPGTVGCSIPRRMLLINDTPAWTWDIYYNGEEWVLLHERCHSLYGIRYHTAHYRAQTGAAE